MLLIKSIGLLFKIRNTPHILYGISEFNTIPTTAHNQQ